MIDRSKMAQELREELKEQIVIAQAARSETLRKAYWAACFDTARAIRRLELVRAK